MMFPQDKDYAIDLLEGALERPIRTGLSHPEAMAAAEKLQQSGKVVRIMHVVGDRRYEVDSYPPR